MINTADDVIEIKCDDHIYYDTFDCRAHTDGPFDYCILGESCPHRYRVLTL
jgi:hypothetical protein